MACLLLRGSAFGNIIHHRCSTSGGKRFYVFKCSPRSPTRVLMDRDHRDQGASTPISPCSDDPEVVRQDDPGMQVVPDTGQTPEVIVGSDSSPTYVDGPHYVQASSIESDSKTNYGQRERVRICGLTPRIFWVLAIVATLIIGAGVGGGIAGGLSRTHASSSTSTSTSTSSSPNGTAASGATFVTSAVLVASSTPTATDSIVGTKTAIYGPSGTVLYRDCPANSNAVYTSDAMQSWVWRKYCDNTTFVSAKPGQQWINAFSNDLDGCIDMCVESNIERGSEIAAGYEDPCNAVCWRNGFENDDHPGQCFGFTTVNVTDKGGFQFQDDWRCDSAGLISQNYIPGRGGF
ncbi:hypothetical protein KVR01_012098 [Diaporthe batatas]|uniref:uncharacterized protein n=1 Tax=Diaporthe batatas TaxID=748121 RepID=UPI001D04386A|nr:uncharacterized protein KVR01_012098 [Diaporthe batatas]KAG8158337.1 hypothetical protein KVR01_012098 [Diaporthe batatas]